MAVAGAVRLRYKLESFIDPLGGNSMTFDGLGMSLGTLSRLSNAQTRSISPENVSGAKGAGGKATEGTGARRRQRVRPGLEGVTEHPSARQPYRHAR